MIGKIRGENNIYDSVIFAIEYRGNKTRVIVFDETFTDLIIYKVWENFSTNVMITDFDCANWEIDTPSFKSLWGQRDIFTRILKQKYKANLLDEAKKINNKAIFPEWNAIENQEIADAFSFMLSDFHDCAPEVIKIEGNNCEILFNTYSGTYIHFKCKDVSKITLTIDSYYSEGVIIVNDNKIIFDFQDEILEAVSVMWKPYFEDKIIVEDDFFSLDKEHFSFNDIDGNNITYGLDKLTGNSIFTNIKLTVGIFCYEEDYSFYKFMLDDSIFTIEYERDKAETDEGFYERAHSIQSIFFAQNYEFHIYELEDIDLEEYELRTYGEVLFREKYSKKFVFWYLFKYSFAIVFGNLFFWLLIKLGNSDMEWIMFYLFGIGVSALVFIMYLYIYFKAYHDTENEIVVYEKAIVYHGNLRFLTIPINKIIAITKFRRIKILTEKKTHKLFKSKDTNKLYDVILTQMEQGENESES